MIDFTSALTLINLVIAVGVIVGGYIAIRSGARNVAEEIQERIKQGLKDENELLQTRLKRCETKVERLEGLFDTTIDLLDQTGYTLILGEDTVTLEGGSKAPRISRRIARLKQEKHD